MQMRNMRSAISPEAHHYRPCTPTATVLAGAKAKNSSSTDTLRRASSTQTPTAQLGLLPWAAAATVCLSAAAAATLCRRGSLVLPIASPNTAAIETDKNAAPQGRLSSVPPVSRLRVEEHPDGPVGSPVPYRDVGSSSNNGSKRPGRRRTLLRDSGNPSALVGSPPGDASGGRESGGSGDLRGGEKYREDASGDATGFDFEAGIKHDGIGGSDGGGGVCAPLEVVGLDRCPELTSDGGTALEKMLSAKADMLRQVIDVLTDPASAGEGGNPDEPLLLVQKLAVDETDAIFGAFEKPYLRHTADAASWSPLPGGFNRWVERYYREVLHGSRPVLVTVHGDNVCALEKEISLEARRESASVDPSTDGGVDNVIERPFELAAAGAGWHERKSNHSSVGENDYGNTEKSSKATPRLHLGDEESSVGSGENFEIPVVLMTLGWDPSGDPTHSERLRGRDRTCTYRVLEMERVVRWFTSHTRYDTHTDEKFRYLPIGFGGHEMRNGLPQKAYLDAAKRQLEILETCPVGNAGSYDMLFQGCTLERNPRTEIWHDMTEGKEVGSPIPVNRAPLVPAKMVAATTKGIFAVSPPGTGPDCFRHYEMMLGGNIPLVPDVYSLRRIMQDLPAFFFGGRESPWGSLTCARLLEMAETVQAKIQERKETRGGGLQLEKLTHGFWRGYIRREVLRAGGETDADAEYVERAALPLNPQGWASYRQVGCFSGGMFLRSRDSDHDHGHHRRRRLHPRQAQEQQEQRAANGERRGLLGVARPENVQLDGSERTPRACAVHCATEIGGGVGFFGISSGNRCWCDKVPGRFVPTEKCDINCDGEKSGGRCGGHYASAVYVFGPEAARGASFEYLGCFPAIPNVMFHRIIRLGKATTPFMCEAVCTSLRLPFFAVERSEYCRCGVMPANSPQSVHAPAYIKGRGYEPDPSPPNATLAAKPVPTGVKVGDPRFECHRKRCGASSKMWGCGSVKAFDLYRNTDPCVLYRDCP